MLAIAGITLEIIQIDLGVDLRFGRLESFSLFSFLPRVSLSSLNNTSTSTSLCFVRLSTHHYRRANHYSSTLYFTVIR